MIIQLEEETFPARRPLDMRLPALSTSRGALGEKNNATTAVAEQRRPPLHDVSSLDIFPTCPAQMSLTASPEREFNRFPVSCVACLPHAGPLVPAAGDSSRHQKLAILQAGRWTPTSGTNAALITTTTTTTTTIASLKIRSDEMFNRMFVSITAPAPARGHGTAFTTLSYARAIKTGHADVTLQGLSPRSVLLNMTAAAFLPPVLDATPPLRLMHRNSETNPCPAWACVLNCADYRTLTRVLIRV
ncbi:hypothetical protein E2C01_057054 [Portunus trituberculatus]|uniref:Uncharacterized protein n=1 Tax=Portunus trituberculatus TaxID=210409 RepID=A0A5B7GS00_PORTR|nr:hypothetical protein [Portunus trituberculatus]